MNPPPANIIHATLPLSFGRDTKALGSFRLVCMPVEVNGPTQGVNM